MEPTVTTTGVPGLAHDGNETLGAQLRRHRLAATLTQERLAEKAGISPAGVAALESGRRRTPRLTTLRLLADALDLDAPQRSALAVAAPPVLPAAPAPRTRDRADILKWLKRATGYRPGIESLGLRPGWRMADPLRWASRPNAALESAWSRRRRLVLVMGQAGVGKTRLTDEVAATLRERGTTVVSGRWTSDWLGPYSGFIAPLRQALSRLDPSKVAGRSELVRLVPELSDSLAPGEGPSRADGGVERRLMFEAVAGVLQRIGPALMLLDDLQWADPDSLALLAYLGGQPLSDLVMLATVRSGDLPPATAGALADLGRVCDIDRLHLERLPSSELDTLVRHIAGDATTPDLLAAVEAASEGNTFYAEELTEHLLHLASAVGD